MLNRLRRIQFNLRKKDLRMFVCMCIFDLEVGIELYIDK